MTRSEIQIERMKGYFVQATKEILKGEGVRGISVRNIAEQAGYSYATLYNYFKDVNELIFICVEDFLEECSEFIQNEITDVPIGIERIKSITKAYAKYFVQYPGIFELFFIEHIADMSTRKSNTNLIYSFLEKECKDDWIYCSENNILGKNEMSVIKDQINYLITGLLVYYLNRRYPDTYKKFTEQINIQLSYVFDRIE
jgi:AcrR family transcriptional regulator